VELKANSPRAKSRAEFDPGVPTTAESGQRPCKIVQRGLGKHRELKIAKGELWRLRKLEPKLGKLLTVLGMRCNGGLIAIRISAAILVKFDATTAARDEIGDCGASGRYIKGGNRAEGGQLARNTCGGCGSARVRLGHEVGDGSDCRAPPGSDAGTRGRPVSR